ncbi:MAG: hypothetical protein AAF195_03205 [Pseudomonadota bacterium]
MAYKDCEITVNTHNTSYKGVFKDLNNIGEMLLEMPDGKKRLVSTGEIFFACDHDLK